MSKLDKTNSEVTDHDHDHHETVSKEGSCGGGCACEENDVNRGDSGYWQDVENKQLDPKILKDEFNDGELQSFGIAPKSRRSFLKIMGFSVTALPMAACVKIPAKKAIPFLHKNDQIVPGVATWFSASYDKCQCGAPLLVKTREGRPIKVEGNALSTWGQGGACGTCQASVLSLYDSSRQAFATKNGQNISHETFIKDLSAELEKVVLSAKKMALVTDEVLSPSKAHAIKKFLKKFPQAKHFALSENSRESEKLALIELGATKSDAFLEYDLSAVDLVLGFEADFLGTMHGATAYSKQYANRRDVAGGQIPIRHIHVESTFSLTGSNADQRFPLHPSQVKMLMAEIYSLLSAQVSVATSAEIKDLAKNVINEMKSHPGRTLVICGPSLGKDAQNLAIKINSISKALNTHVKIVSPDFYKSADAVEFEELVSGLEKNQYGAVIFSDVNVAYFYPDSNRLLAALKNATVASLTYAPDETSEVAQYVAPILHSFETWTDRFSSSKEIAVGQAVINVLGEGKDQNEILCALAGENISAYDLNRQLWRAEIYPKASLSLSSLSFELFWDKVVHDGVMPFDFALSSSVDEKSNGALERLLSETKDLAPQIVSYKKVSMKNSIHANNPWLQEMPDPVTKVTWDNYVQIASSFAKEQNLKQGDVLKLSASGQTIKLPVLIQPGLAQGVFAIATGYGRKVCGKAGKDVGQNIYPLLKDAKNVKVEKTSQSYQLAQTQTHHSMEGRDIVRERTWSDFKTNPEGKKKIHFKSMWSEHKKDGKQWAMAIDLSKCNGCTACVVSCNAENNVPVVGRQEVLNRREMHWMRIDRYYKGSDENPEVVYQPMNCQHCDNAPCETVCPVLATVQSSDGLNQQVYNRCVGTRYCANNCPYKVRRFNWFDYPHQDANENMVLNPDVVVRSRGVMEKCSLCVQRIQEGKLKAKQEGRDINDGEIKLACQQSCPSDAIVFGDMNDKNSKIYKMLHDPRNYTVLEELNVLPRVSYLTKIRNKG